MKTLNDYLAMSYRMEIVEDKDEGGFVVSYPELPGCITCGETIERAVENAADAKKAWLEAALEEGIEIHEPGRKSDRYGEGAAGEARVSPGGDPAVLSGLDAESLFRDR